MIFRVMLAIVAGAGAIGVLLALAITEWMVQ